MADPITPTPILDDARGFVGTVQEPRRERLDGGEPAAQKSSINARHTIDELLEQTDFEALADDEDLNVWLNIKPVGREILE